MTSGQENDLIGWIRATPCLYQKGLRDYRDTKWRSHLLVQKAAEMEMTGEFSFLNN